MAISNAVIGQQTHHFHDNGSKSGSYRMFPSGQRHHTTSLQDFSDIKVWWLSKTQMDLTISWMNDESNTVRLVFKTNYDSFYHLSWRSIKKLGLNMAIKLCSNIPYPLTDKWCHYPHFKKLVNKTCHQWTHFFEMKIWCFHPLSQTLQKENHTSKIIATCEISWEVPFGTHHSQLKESCCSLLPTHMKEKTTRIWKKQRYWGCIVSKTNHMEILCFSSIGSQCDLRGAIHSSKERCGDNAERCQQGELLVCPKSRLSLLQLPFFHGVDICK